MTSTQLIDTATFDDDTLAAALDRVILKTRDGAAQAASAIQAAIARAEDFVYLETPALDAADRRHWGRAIGLVDALITRLAARPALTVLLCVPRSSCPASRRRSKTCAAAASGPR